MGIGRDPHRGGRTLLAPSRQVAAAAALMLLLVIAASGCGSRETATKSSSAAPSSAAAAKPGTNAGETSAAHESRVTESTPSHGSTASHSEAKASGATSHKAAVSTSHGEVRESGWTGVVLLTDKGCVDFQPHWVSLQAGQSLTWRSELKSAITIHVTPGAFDKAEYEIHPGASVSTGPARSAGSFTIWTDPAACQTAPHGPEGPGPGVTIEGPPKH